MYLFQAATNIEQEFFALEESPIKLTSNKLFLLVTIVVLPLLLSIIILLTQFVLKPSEVVFPIGLISLLLLNIYLWHINRNNNIKHCKLMIGYNEIKIIQGGKISAVAQIEDTKFETIHQINKNNQVITLIKIEAQDFPSLLISQTKISTSSKFF